MPSFYDTHAHLDHQDFGPDLPQVLERAGAAGITKIITVATDLRSSARAIQLAEKFPQVFAVVGWHPNDALLAPDDLRPALRELARHPKVVGIGEIGLDYYRLPPRKDGPNAAEVYVGKQKAIFQQQLEVAAELGLNCVIHQRSALEDTLALFAPFASRVRAVFHCFVDGPEVVRRIREFNSLVSFTGILTFKNGQNVRETLAATPLEQMMLETDCPYLAPMPYRGQRCEPAYVKEIALAVAEIKGCSLETLSAATWAAADAFFTPASHA